jgi:TetR/AcrR family transcriptional regulator
MTTADRDGDTEQRILDAAHKVFLRRGTAGARMQEIAEEAGVNKALLHYYFRSKDRLAEAVFRRLALRLLPRVIDVLGSDAEIEEKVERVIDLELSHLSRSPFLPGYIICELNHHPERARQLVQTITGMPIDGLAPRLFEKLNRQIEQRVRARTMRQIAADQFVINLISLCIFPFAARPMLMALLGLDQDGFRRFIERRKPELAAFFLAALRP